MQNFKGGSLAKLCDRFHLVGMMTVSDHFLYTCDKSSCFSPGITRQGKYDSEWNFLFSILEFSHITSVAIKVENRMEKGL